MSMKKIVVVTIALLLIASVILSGCGKKQTQPTNKETVTPTAPSQGESTETDKDMSDLEGLDEELDSSELDSVDKELESINDW
ncbi:hypothetical protein FJZ53_03090 [Candidatus Woesearchaeota archaeon]|nr:hypothetical protein [Candidatus Woesearchaeota archaeon]